MRWSECERERWCPEGAKGVMTWKRSEVTAEEMKEARMEGAEEVKVGPTKWTVTGIGRLRERRELGIGGCVGMGLARGFFRVEGREEKESLAASGSFRACWLRNESRPMIGAAATVAMRRRRERSTAAGGILTMEAWGGPMGLWSEGD